MGQLFTRLTTGWSDQQPSPIITHNNFVAVKPIRIKRKRIEQDTPFKKRKLFNEYNLLSFSPRISKSIKPFNFANTSIISQSLSPLIIFKCQLCCQCFASKDYYLDHMIICAYERHASIKIVRAKTRYPIQS